MLDQTRYVGLGDIDQRLDALSFARPSHAGPNDQPKLQIQDLNFWYGNAHALKSVSLKIHRNETMALIGPSGCGKSTFLLCLNRMNDDVRDTHRLGQVLLDGEDVYAPDIDPPLLRRRFGWVAQKPNPFPWSVYDNIAYGAMLHGFASSKSGTNLRADLDNLVENFLRQAGLWDELKDRLDEPGTSLSGGQQQRLCVARALSVSPEVLLMDEPCGSLDPLSTERIEQLIKELSERLTIVIVTHNMEQAARVSQRVAFFKLGELLETGLTRDVFANPQNLECQAYLRGQFG